MINIKEFTEIDLTKREYGNCPVCGNHNRNTLSVKYQVTSGSTWEHLDFFAKLELEKWEPDFTCHPCSEKGEVQP